MSLFNPLLLQMSLFFCCYIIKININYFMYFSIYGYETLYSDFFYDVCKNICSVTSFVKTSPLKQRLDAQLCYLLQSSIISIDG